MFGKKKQDDRRERADQDLWLEKAKMNRRIREIQEERGSIKPASKQEDQHAKSEPSSK